VLNFIALDLQLYKIFKIRPVSFFGTLYMLIIIIIITDLYSAFRSEDTEAL